MDTLPPLRRRLQRSQHRMLLHSCRSRGKGIRRQQHGRRSRRKTGADSRPGQALQPRPHYAWPGFGRQGGPAQAVVGPHGQAQRRTDRHGHCPGLRQPAAL
eukprot:113794-Heterocapsa_arctica.AAC.1